MGGAFSFMKKKDQAIELPEWGECGCLRMDESHQQLLQTLKSVVEGLLNCQVANVWNIYGGLSRLHSVIEKILKHEFRIFKPNGEEDCWIFIQGLNWLQPSLATNPSPISPNSPPPHPHTEKAMIWLHNCLETHTLSEKLSWLVSDEHHLSSCYNPRAFLRQPRYVEAALVCLRAIEQNQLPLLAEIHPCLYLSERSLRAQEKFHRRCSSFPETIQRKMWSPISFTLDSKKETTTEMADLAVEASFLDCKTDEEESNISEQKTKKIIFYRIKPWKSVDDLLLEVLMNKKPMEKTYYFQSQTEPSSPAKHALKLSPSVLRVNYSTVLKDSPFSIKVKRNESLSSTQATNLSSGESTENDKLKKPERRKKKSFIEDGGGRSIKRMTTGSSFPKPEQGQSLTSFLSSKLFAQSSAELDRENLHFSVCEALISAIEQVKCNEWEKKMCDAADESDEEIKELKQRIRIRRRQKQEESTPVYCSDTTTTTDQSFSPRSSDSMGGSNDSLTSVDDVEVDQITAKNLVEMNKSGLSLSMASLYSEADLGSWRLKGLFSTSPPSVISSVSTAKNSSSTIPSSSPILSQAKTAEQVGLSLLSKFNDQQLPKASELHWILSDEDVPEQKLIPLPETFVADLEPDKDSIALRGTEDWAPPRPQLILTTHRPPVRNTQMMNQNFRCAGCGMKVAPEYSHRFRYCDYITKYFCTGCHKNKQTFIPGRILFKWEFKKYPVSDFSFNLIEHMMHDPLFNINDLNPDLYKRVKNLERFKKSRKQLSDLNDFLTHCQYYAQELKQDLEKVSSHLLSDCDTYSMVDLIQIKTGESLEKLNRIINSATNHVANCQLCQGRGFMCEMCRLKDVIFPWQIDKVSRCSKCGSCHHNGCLRNAVSCPRCTRLANRGLSVS